MARQSSTGWACGWLVSAVFWSRIEKNWFPWPFSKRKMKCACTFGSRTLATCSESAELSCACPIFRREKFPEPTRYEYKNACGQLANAKSVRKCSPEQKLKAPTSRPCVPSFFFFFFFFWLFSRRIVWAVQRIQLLVKVRPHTSVTGADGHFENFATYKFKRSPKCLHHHGENCRNKFQKIRIDFNVHANPWVKFLKLLLTAKTLAMWNLQKEFASFKTFLAKAHTCSHQKADFCWAIFNCQNTRFLIGYGASRPTA